MDKVIPQTQSPIFALICTAFGHDYIVTQNITDQISKYECSCCGKQTSLEQLFEEA